jgi:hypothetical protein
MDIPFDIETIPGPDEEGQLARIRTTITHPASMSKESTIKAWHAGEEPYVGVKEACVQEAYRKQALSGAKGRICSLTFAVEKGTRLFSFYLLPPGEFLRMDVEGYQINCDTLHTFATEAELLDGFFTTLLPHLNGRPPYWIGHYIGGFDLRFLFQRCVVNGVRPGVGIMQDGRHPHDFFDTQSGWAGFKGTIGADALSEALGMVPQQPGEIDGSGVWDAYKAGDHHKVLHHNQWDVRRTQEHHRRLTMVPARAQSGLI